LFPGWLYFSGYYTSVFCMSECWANLKYLITTVFFLVFLFGYQA
jgi:hypothetical protein